jgi:hypothetical protein
MSKVLICKESAIVDVDGVPTRIVRGQTTAREGAAILDRYGDLFEEQKVDYDADENTSARTRDTGRVSAVAKAAATRATKRAAKKAAPKPGTAANPLSKSALKKSDVPTPPKGPVPSQGLTTDDLKGAKAHQDENAAPAPDASDGSTDNA